MKKVLAVAKMETGLFVIQLHVKIRYIIGEHKRAQLLTCTASIYIYIYVCDGERASVNTHNNV